jgi:nucleoside-diphosphate-sugar epimerase
MQKSFNYYRNKRIAVSGASGFIGSYLLNELSKHSKAAFGLSRKKTKIKKLKVLKIDLNKEQDIKKIIKKFDIFFHFAADTNLNRAEKNPHQNFTSNVKPILNLINHSIKLKKKIKIIFASTGTVYGLNKKKYVTEEDTPSPITVYDKHKLLVEKILKTYTSFNIIDSVSLRIQSVYGKSLVKSKDNTRGVLNKIIKKSLTNRYISVYGGGNYFRNYIHVSDLVNAFLTAGLNKKINGMVLNVGSSKTFKFIDVCKIIRNEIFNLKNKKIKILYPNWPINIDLINKRKYVLNCNKFKKITHWKEKIKIVSGIRSTVNSFQKY